MIYYFSRRRFAATLAAFAAATAATAAGPTDPVRVGGGSIITRLALRRGAFGGRGLSVSISETRGSAGIRNALLSGDVDILDYGVDNALALAAEGAPIAILFGSTSFTYEVIAQPDIQDISSLRGRTLLVDDPDTQGALALRKTLLSAGLHAGADYSLEAFGGTPSRIAALLSDRRYAATVASGPALRSALAAGLRSLAVTAEHTGPLLLYAGYGLRPWASAHPDRLERYIAAHIDTVRWMRDPEHRAEVIAAIQAELSITAEEAALAYQEGIGNSGWEADAALDLEKLTNVIDLRRSLSSGPAGHALRIEDLVDTSYLSRATGIATTPSPAGAARRPHR